MNPGDPWQHERIDRALSSAALRSEISASGGKKYVLEADAAQPDTGAMTGYLTDFTALLRVSGSQLGTTYGGTRRWKQAIPDLLPTPGKYTIVLSGTIKTDKRTLEIESKPLEFEVVKADAQHQSIAQIDRIAAASIQKRFGLKAPPRPASPTIDDVNDKRWVRFAVDEASEGYDLPMIEMRLDPAGREEFFDSYNHFTCVAAGTLIETPAGEIPVERLRVGDQVISYDVERKARVQSNVERIERAHAEKLFVFGRLRVTGEHPLFADGRWVHARELPAGAALLGSDLTTIAAEPVHVVEPAVVFDIGVSAPHTYFAGGLLVHNKATATRVPGDVSWDGYFSRRAAKPR